MTAQPDWGNNYIQGVRSLISSIQNCRLLLDQLTTDTTLATKYLATGLRSDLTTTDFTNANSALTQVIFAFDSGSPTQKSYLYKLT